MRESDKILYVSIKAMKKIIPRHLSLVAMK